MIGFKRHKKLLALCVTVLFLSVQTMVLLHYLLVDHHANIISEGVTYTKESEKRCELHDFFRYSLSEDFLPENSITELDYTDFILLGERFVWCESYAVLNIYGRAPPACFLHQTLKQIQLI